MEAVEDMNEMDGQQPQVDYAELVKADVIALYKEKSEQAGLEPHDAFM